MDGSCVPLKGVEAGDLEKVSLTSELPLDAHLMVDDQRGLYRRIRGTKNLRNVILTIEKAPFPEISSLIDEIRSDHLSPFVSIWPGTPLSLLDPFVSLVDGILIMTTEAGVPNSVYIDDAEKRVGTIVEMYSGHGLKFLVDGGMNFSRLQIMQACGVGECVVGRSFFNTEERSSVMKLRAR